MSIEDKSSFEKNWTAFITRLKGQIISRSQKHEMGYQQLRLLLSDAALSWVSGEEACGRWLMTYSRSNPAKGESIRDILTKDMQFTELPPPKKAYNETLNYVIPVAGAAAGFGISSMFKATTLIKAISTIAPAAVLYPSAKSLGDNLNKNSKSLQLEEYIDQLEKYKLSVISVLETS